MMTAQRFLTALILLCLLAAPAAADEKVSLKAGYARMSVAGDATVSADGRPGTSLELNDDLSLDDSDGYQAEAGLQLGSFRLFAAYLPIHLSAEGTLAKSVDFNGETFVSGSRVDSDVRVDIYEAGLAWFAVNLDDTPLRLQLGPELAVKYIDARLEMQEAALGLNESESVAVPIPSVGLRARIAVADYLGVIGRVGYMHYDNSSFVDTDLQVEFSPLPLVGINGGYRYLALQVDNGDDLYLDTTFSGPYVGVMLRF
jgi:hypothetical protein